MVPEYSIELVLRVRLRDLLKTVGLNVLVIRGKCFVLVGRSFALRKINMKEVKGEGGRKKDISR